MSSSVVQVAVAAPMGIVGTQQILTIEGLTAGHTVPVIHEPPGLASPREQQVPQGPHSPAAIVLRGLRPGGCQSPSEVAQPRRAEIEVAP